MNFLFFFYSFSSHFLPKGVREEKPKIFSTAIVLVLSMNNTMLPQENSHGHLNDSLPKEIRSYIDLLSGYESYDSYDKLLMIFDNMPLDQLKHAAKIMY